MTIIRNGESKHKNKEEFIVKHKGEKYDIARFLQFHPGGRNSVSPYKDLSITEKLSKIDHSHAAMYLMKEYKLSGSRVNKNEEDLEVSNMNLYNNKKIFNMTMNLKHN